MKLGSRLSCTAAVATLLCIVATAGTAVAELPPNGRSYFTTVLGLANTFDQSYQINVVCIRFTDDQLCVSDADCGTWELSQWGEPGVKQGEFEFEFNFIDDESGTPISMRGIARIDARGRRSTIAGAAHATDALGALINLGFAGRQVPPRQCERLVEEFLQR
ncbi:MAG: hypothetical protein P8Y44_03820 [Acidobacteriota bacterium]